MRLTLFIFNILLLYFCGCTNPLYLLNTNSRSISMSYLTPVTTDGFHEYMRVEFHMILTSALAYTESASGICVRAADSTYTLSVGSKAFGISFICTVTSGCNSATSLNVVFYSSTLSAVSPPTWSGGGYDYSTTNVGSSTVGTGADFTTRYGFYQWEASNSNIPLESEVVYLKCFGKYYENKNNVRLDSNLDISSWETETKTFTVAKTEYKCEKGITCNSNVIASCLLILALTIVNKLLMLHN